MTMNFKANLDELLAPILYILDKVGDTGPHKLFKILYFADRDHIKRFGRPLSDDHYFKLDAGPVPSEIYNWVKIAGDRYDWPIPAGFDVKVKKYLASPHNTQVKALKKADRDYLSESAIQSLDSSIAKYKKKSFEELKSLSHDRAWNSVSLNKEIPVTEIAKAAGASAEMIRYIESSL